MTQTEIYNTIKTAMADNAEVVEFCDKKIASLAKKAEKDAAKAAESAAFRDTIMDALVAAEGPLTAKEIADSIESTARKVSANMRFLVEDGRVERIVASKGKAAQYSARA